ALPLVDPVRLGEARRVVPAAAVADDVPAHLGSAGELAVVLVAVPRPDDQLVIEHEREEPEDEDAAEEGDKPVLFHSGTSGRKRSPPNANGRALLGAPRG